MSPSHLSTFIHPCIFLFSILQSGCCSLSQLTWDEGGITSRTYFSEVQHGGSKQQCTLTFMSIKVVNLPMDYATNKQNKQAQGEHATQKLLPSWCGFTYSIHKVFLLPDKPITKTHHLVKLMPIAYLCIHFCSIRKYAVMHTVQFALFPAVNRRSTLPLLLLLHYLQRWRA